MGQNINSSILENIIKQIEQQINFLENPFSDEIKEGELFLNNQIIGSSEIKNEFLRKNINQIFSIIHNQLNIDNFVVIFDEFSILPKELQEYAISQIISGFQSSSFGVYVKIAIINGRFLVDPMTADLRQHGFSNFQFEHRFYDIFRGRGGEKALYDFFKKIFNQKISDLFKNGKLKYNGEIYKKKNVYRAFFEDEETFKLLVKLAGYNVRRFYRMINGLANLSRNASKIRYTKKKVYTYQITKGLVFHYITRVYARNTLKTIKRSLQIKKNYAQIEKFLRELIKKQRMGKNKKGLNPLFFQWVDNNPSKLIKRLKYFGVITPITIRRNQRRPTGREYPIYLIEMGIYLHFLSVRSKFGTMNDLNPFENPKHVQVYRPDDF